jgi:predicted DNA-binding ribbon-helix-helix protein
MDKSSLQELQRMRKRSIAVAGHRTSVSLENAFWLQLNELAAARGMSVARLVTEIDRMRAGNLSSAIRVYVLTETAERAQAPTPRKWEKF